MTEPARELEAEQLVKKLHGDERHKNLLLASTLLGVFELLKSAVILAPTNVIPPDSAGGRLVLSTFVKGKFRPAPSYRTRVMKKDNDEYRAAGRWLGEVGGLTTDECATLLAIREHRNDVAHELASYLIDPRRQINSLAIVDSHQLLTKVGRWSARRSSEAFGGKSLGDLPDEEIEVGSVMIANLIIATLAERTEPRP